MSEAGSGDVGATAIDPTEFVADDVGPSTEVAGDHAAAEGAETPTASDMGSTSRFSTFKSILLQSSPSPALTEVDDPWNPEEGGPTRIYRGLQKMAGFDGMPAIGDVLIGVLETVKSFSLEGASDDVDDNDNSVDAGAGGAELEADVDDPITAQVKANDEA